MSRKIRWCNSFYLYFAVIVALVDKYEFDRMFQSRKFCKKKIFEFWIKTKVTRWCFEPKNFAKEIFFFF